MAVRDLRGSGAYLPKPDGDPGKVGEEDGELTTSVKKLAKDALKARAVASAFGMTGLPREDEDNGRKKDKDVDALTATTVVAKVLGQNDKYTDRLEEAQKRMETKVEEARKSEDSAKEKLYAEKLDRINETLDAIRSPQTTPVQAAIEKAVTKIIEDTIMSPKKEKPEPIPGGDNSFTVQLAQMNLQNSRELLLIRKQMADDNRKWDLQMKQMDNDSKLKWQEYQDKKETRNQIFSLVEDIGGSAGKSINLNMNRARGVVDVGANAGGSTPAPPQSGPPATSGLPAETARPPSTRAMSEIACPNCSEPVGVPEGITQGICPFCEEPFNLHEMGNV